MQLLVEIADKSREYDGGRRASNYAGLGLPDYWVIDARSLVTRVYRGPGAGGDVVTPLALPSLGVSLSALGLRPAAD